MAVVGLADGAGGLGLAASACCFCSPVQSWRAWETPAFAAACSAIWSALPLASSAAACSAAAALSWAALAACWCFSAPIWPEAWASWAFSAGPYSWSATMLAVSSSAPGPPAPRGRGGAGAGISALIFSALTVGARWSSPAGSAASFAPWADAFATVWSRCAFCSFICVRVGGAGERELRRADRRDRDGAVAVGSASIGCLDLRAAPSADVALRVGREGAAGRQRRLRRRSGRGRGLLRLAAGLLGRFRRRRRFGAVLGVLLVGRRAVGPPPASISGGWPELLVLLLDVVDAAFSAPPSVWSICAGFRWRPR